jgi:hypothetical protein
MRAMDLFYAIGAEDSRYDADKAPACEGGFWSAADLPRISFPYPPL